MRALIRLSCKLNKFRPSRMLRIHVNAFEPLARNHFPIWTLCILRALWIVSKGCRLCRWRTGTFGPRKYIYIFNPHSDFQLCVFVQCRRKYIIILLCRQKKSVAARSPQLSVCCLCDCVRIHNNVIISTCISIDCRIRREYACLQAQL